MFCPKDSERTSANKGIKPGIKELSFNLKTDTWWLCWTKSCMPREKELFSHFVLFQSLSSQSNFKICSQLSSTNHGNHHTAFKSVHLIEIYQPLCTARGKQRSGRGHNIGYEGKNQQIQKVSEAEEKKMAFRGFLRSRESLWLLGNLWVEQISKELKR